MVSQLSVQQHPMHSSVPALDTIYLGVIDAIERGIVLTLLGIQHSTMEGLIRLRQTMHAEGLAVFRKRRYREPVGPAPIGDRMTLDQILRDESSQIRVEPVA